MSDDPKRWRDDAAAPARVRELLKRSAAVPAMSPGVRDALRAGVAGAIVAAGAKASSAGAAAGAGANAGGAGVAGGSAAGAATTVVGTTSGSLFGGAIVVGLAAIGLVVAIGTRSTSGDAPPLPRVTTSAAHADFGPATAAPSASTVAATALAAEASTTAGSNASPIPRASAVPVPPAASPFPAVPRTGAPTAPASAFEAPANDPNAIREEVALVTRARGNPSDALAATEEHARRFPHGELASERDYLRCKALARLGRREEAKQAARAFLVTHPSSPQAKNVRAILAELEAE